MSRRKIRLGEEIEDVTAKVGGIAIGRIEYLDGTTAWLMQPPYGEDGRRIPIVEAQDAYVRRIGGGVFVEPKLQTGFHVRDEQDAKQG